MKYRILRLVFKACAYAGVNLQRKVFGRGVLVLAVTILIPTYFATPYVVFIISIASNTLDVRSDSLTINCHHSRGTDPGRLSSLGKSYLLHIYIPIGNQPSIIKNTNPKNILQCITNICNEFCI